MCSGVCSRRSAKQTGSGKCSDESAAAARFNGARRRGVGVWCSRGACAKAVRCKRASRWMTSLSGTVSRMLREVMFASPVWSCVLLCVSQPAISWPVSPVVIAGTVWCSAVKFQSILGSRNNFAFFGPSAAATRRLSVPMQRVGHRRRCPQRQTASAAPQNRTPIGGRSCEDPRPTAVTCMRL